MNLNLAYRKPSNGWVREFNFRKRGYVFDNINLFTRCAPLGETIGTAASNITATTAIILLLLLLILVAANVDTYIWYYLTKRENRAERVSTSPKRG